MWGGSFFELHLSTKLAIKFFEEVIGDRPMRPLSSWPSVLGEVFRVDAMADLEGVAVNWGLENFPHHRSFEGAMVFSEAE